jgi:hypothetical protein
MYSLLDTIRPFEIAVDQMNVHITNATLEEQLGVCVAIVQMMVEVFFLQITGRAIVAEEERRWYFDDVWAEKTK